MSARVLPALALILAGSAAQAAPMAESPRPAARPAVAAAMPSPPVLALAALRPAPRPEAAAPEVTRATSPASEFVLPPAGTISAILTSPRPEARPGARTPEAPPPGGVLLAAFRVPPAKGPVTGRKGSVCGDPEILGKAIPPILGKVRGCGLEDGVAVIAIAGVALSQPASIDCATAAALKDWVEEGVKPAVGRKGGGVAALQIAASYACRPRNNQKGAKISEHGHGRAVDISAILLADGTAMTVAKGWGTKAQGPTLAAMRQAACGPFNTVLGPGSDRFHSDHFHLDTAQGRGAYCR